MSTISDSYNRFRAFIDDFANSSTSSVTITSCQAVNREAWYAEWDDNYMGDLIGNNLVKSVLRRVADTYYNTQIDEIIEESTELTADTFPKLFEIYTSCCETLGMAIAPQTYVTTRMKGINALSLEVKGKPYVLISPQVAILLTESEQSFLVGHELGHHQQGNLVCHTVNGLLDTFGNVSDIIGPILIDTIEVPLRGWCRCSEFNADRAGYLCCKDSDAILRLFQRLGMHSPLSAYAQYHEVSCSHPLLPTRWGALQEYIRRNQFK